MQGYEYFTDDSGSTKAVQVATGEVTDTVWMCLPIGTQIRTPEEIVAQNEYLKLKEQNELRRLSNKDLGKFFFISNKEDLQNQKLILQNLQKLCVKLNGNGLIISKNELNKSPKRLTS